MQVPSPAKEEQVSEPTVVQICEWCSTRLNVEHGPWLEITVAFPDESLEPNQFCSAKCAGIWLALHDPIEEATREE